LLQQVIQAIGAVLLGLIGVLLTWLTPKLQAWLGQEAACKAAGLLDQALHYALAWGQAEVAQKVAAGAIVVDVKSAAVAQAAQYLQTQMPAKLKAMGIDPAALDQKLEARYAYNTTPPEQSAAIPTPALGRAEGPPAS
jgi:hypothetical protein